MIILSKKIISLIFIVIYIFYFFHEKCEDKFILNNSDKIKYDLVLPVNNNDIIKLLGAKEIFRKYIKYEKIVIIAPKEIEYFNENINMIFIDENNLLPKEDLTNLFAQIGITKINRIGWYEQQFLKMAYSRICNKEYYLLWDSDTIPIKQVNMFEKNHPIFDMKKEHHYPYFITLDRLIPNLKFSKKSYISEHMIIKTEYMRNLLNEIENNKNIPGIYFWEKIILSIDKNEIPFSGFSEFETYGSYVDNRFPKFYKHRNWNSQRDMSKFYYSIDNLKEKDVIWLSKDYNAISFENWDYDDKSNFVAEINSEIKNKIRPKRFFKYYKRIIKNKKL